MKASIVGVTGYTGIELVRLIRRHPLLELGTLHSHSTNGVALSEVYPQFADQVEVQIEPFDSEAIMEKNDLVFFATPSGISKDLVKDFASADFPVIDLSGDLRLKDPAQYKEWYGKEPAPQATLDQAFYALPEFYEEAKGNLISNPGCYATAAELTLAPLLIEKLIDTDSIIVDGKSGLSGAGKKLTDSSHFVNVNENMSMYKLNKHQHIPEILQQLHQWEPAVKTIQFTTSLIPVTRGILLSTYVKLKAGVSEEIVAEAFQKCYRAQPFVRVQPIGHLPQIKQVAGSNFCDIGFGKNPGNGILTVVTVIDNLVKGAAGQAIQNFNKWAKIDETSGLTDLPLFP